MSHPIPEEPVIQSIVIDRDNDAWQRISHKWVIAGSEGFLLDWEELYRQMGPITIVWSPSDAD